MVAVKEPMKTGKRSYRCPNGCLPEVDTPFYYPPCCADPGGRLELGVLAYPDLTVSNRLTDGTVGVTEEIRDQLAGHDCLPHCIECQEEIVVE